MKFIAARIHKYCILAVLLFCNFLIQAQTEPITATKILKRLSDQNRKDVYWNHNTMLDIFKSGQSKKIFEELEAKADDHQLRSQIYLLKAVVLYYEDVDPTKNKLGEEDQVNPAVKAVILELYKRAMNEAYLSGNERLIAQVSIIYGHECYILKELELAVTYTLNGLELNEKLGIINIPNNYLVVGEIFYKIREYDACIENSIKAFKLVEPSKERGDTVLMMFSSNTAALGYHRMQQYDSAFFWYQTSLKMAKILKGDLWVGIVGGNMGQIFYEQKKYDTALSLFQADYNLSKEFKLFDNAANSLQWAARTQVRLGNNTAALQYVREAFGLLQQKPDMFYLRNTYQAAVDVFKSMGSYDSAFYYNTKYSALNDSLERVIALSGIAVSKARANDEKNRYRIQSLQREKEKQVWQRNMLIAAIVLLGTIGFLSINRHRLKVKMQLERMEQEMMAARTQLKMFTENIIEKTNLIEQLEEQIKTKGVSEEQQLVMNELTRQTILTDEEWNQFKTLFLKIYPSFFNNLKQKSPDITIAEQRMAALTRLQLTSRQMASMLGISVDSVHKARQRVRQRLQLTTETNMEEFLAQL